MILIDISNGDIIRKVYGLVFAYFSVRIRIVFFQDLNLRSRRRSHECRRRIVHHSHFLLDLILTAPPPHQLRSLAWSLRTHHLQHNNCRSPQSR